MATKEELLLALLDIRKHEDHYLLRTEAKVEAFSSSEHSLSEIIELALMQVDLKSKSQFVLFLDTPRTAIYQAIEEETIRQGAIEGEPLINQFDSIPEAIGLLLECFRPAGRQVAGPILNLSNTILQTGVVLIAVLEWLGQQLGKARFQDTIRLVVDKTFYSGDGK